METRNYSVNVTLILVGQLPEFPKECVLDLALRPLPGFVIGKEIGRLPKEIRDFQQ